MTLESELVNVSSVLYINTWHVAMVSGVRVEINKRFWRKRERAQRYSSRKKKKKKIKSLSIPLLTGESLRTMVEMQIHKDLITCIWYTVLTVNWLYPNALSRGHWPLWERIPFLENRQMSIFSRDPTTTNLWAFNHEKHLIPHFTYWEGEYILGTLK